MMRKHRFLLSDNHGSSLIMVLVCFAFVAMLGTIIISAAITNLEMKTVNEQSKQSFYQAEAALDEIKVGLTEDVSQYMATAYEKVLELYSATKEADRDTLFEAEFTTAMRNIYNPGGSLATGVVFNSYLKETKYNAATQTGAAVEGNPTWNVAPGDSILFKGVKVVYTSEDYQTVITTDIRVVYPSIAIVSPSGVMEKRPYLNYTLIANNGLWINTNVHSVTGDVYAGSEGINIRNNGNRLSVSNGLIVTRGDIIVKDQAKLIISGTSSEVWAKNLKTEQTDKTITPISETVIDVNASCYIQDDLVLGAPKSNVTLAGEYYGYSSGYLSDGTSTNDPAQNSAIMINADDAILNMVGLAELKVAGRAFINMTMNKVSYTPDPTEGAEPNSNSNILTGESVTVKGAQTPYLVPSEFILVGQNPVSWNDYITYYNETTMTDGMVNTAALLASDAFVSDLVSDDQAKFSYYLNPVTPVKRAFYKFGGDVNVVYYYLNFASDKEATTYFYNYNLCYHDKLYNGFDIGGILVNDTAGSVMTSGNMISFDGDVQVTAGNKKVYVNNNASKYDNLIHTLQKNVTSSKYIYENIVNVTNIEADANPTIAKTYDTLGTGYIAYFIDNDDKNTSDDAPGIADDDKYVFNQTGKSGIIVATGDIELHTDFSGMVISGGDVFLEGSANLISSPTIVNQILMNDTSLTKYFNDITATAGVEEDWNAIDVSSLILFENWRKN